MIGITKIIIFQIAYITQNERIFPVSIFATVLNITETYFDCTLPVRIFKFYSSNFVLYKNHVNKNVLNSHILMLPFITI